MKNLKVFIFQQNWFHLGSLLEASINHGKIFKSVNFYYVEKNLYVKPLERHQDFLGSSMFNPPPESIIARYLTNFFTSGETMFSSIRVKLERKSQLKSLFQGVESVSDLQKIQWEKTEIGMAISSFIISLTRDSDPILNQYNKLINNLELAYFQIFKYLDSLNLSSSKDEIWVCNGRPFHERVVVEYARIKSIPTKFYEIGGDGSNQERWILHENSPHNRLAHQESIKQQFRLTTPNLISINEWFRSQRPGGQNIFTKNFDSNIGNDLLDNFFVYFSSSDDEVSAISREWVSSWKTQLNAVNELIRVFVDRPDLKLVIRVHPNQKNKSENDKNKWKSLVSQSRNVFIYNFDSNINSYELLSKAKGVFTYGSTIGVEASYLKKPAALLSNSRWDSIIPQEYLRNREDIESWIDRVNKKGMLGNSRLEECYLGSLMWGHYMQTAGNNWTFIKIKKDFRNVNVGYLGGKSLKPPLFVIGITRVIRFLRLHVVEMKFDLSRINRFHRGKWEGPL